jgi:hypothetical protein
LSAKLLHSKPLRTRVATISGASDSLLLRKQLKVHSDQLKHLPNSILTQSGSCTRSSRLVPACLVATASISNVNDRNILRILLRYGANPGYHGLQDSVCSSARVRGRAVQDRTIEISRALPDGTRYASMLQKPVSCRNHQSGCCSTYKIRTMLSAFSVTTKSESSHMSARTPNTKFNHRSDLVS